jgi:2-polyprenyl-3-methyl-5-hydroxy-6-metoxy-1,4-benzoquinol methylase
MADWDKIYKGYNKGGKEWQAINDGMVPFCFLEGINPLFIDFIEKAKFKSKRVLDIGCGNGKYLVFLSELGFYVDGIDSSETSVEMTKKALRGKAGEIRQADMFDMEIKNGKYDLIISISTINHGYKKDFQKLIAKIHTALITDGKFFANIPDKKCLGTWRTFKKYKTINENTVLPLLGPEKDIPHSFYTKKEIEEVLDKFTDLKMKKDKHGQWIVIAGK